MLARISSPGFRNTRGLRAMPTPGGVPVVMTSPGSKRHEFADIGDQCGDPENHPRGRAGLHPRAVQIERQIETLRVGDLIGGDQPGPQRSERIVALGLDPFARTAFLQTPLGDVVADRVARDIVQRVGLGDALRARADHHGKLDLVVHPLEALGRKHRIVWPRDARACLGEHDGHFGDRHAGLLGMVPVVQADAEKFRHHTYRRADSRIAFDQGQRRKVEAP